MDEPVTKREQNADDTEYADFHGFYICFNLRLSATSE
jgi:hypothetical protein